MKKTTVLNITTVVVTTVFSLAMVELVCRLVLNSVPRPDQIHKTMLTGHYVPSVFARYVLDGKSGTVQEGWENAQYYINDKGYRGADFRIEKPEGTTRIIVYGGSAVFDVAMSLGQDWPHKIGDLWNARHSESLEVINAGLPGHTSWESFGKLFAEGHRFKPDYVVLYHAWNDLKWFNSEQTLLRRVKVYQKNADPYLNYQNAADRFLGGISQIYLRARYKYYSLKVPSGLEGKKRTLEPMSQINPQGLRQFRIAVEMFVELAHSIGATPVLMTQARLVTADNSESQKQLIGYRHQPFTQAALVTAFNEIDRILFDVGAQKGAILIDASKEMTGQSRFFIDHVHLNKEGSDFLSELVVLNLEQIIRANKQ